MIKEMQLLNIPSESILTPVTAICGQTQGFTHKVKQKRSWAVCGSPVGI